VHELVAETASLEQAYLELTQGSVEYRPDAQTAPAALRHTAA
jgi:hypothetical protein